MASKTEVMPQKEAVPEEESPETRPDSPLVDLSDAAVKKLIRSAKNYVTPSQPMYSQVSVRALSTSVPGRTSRHRKESAQR
jgi:hypothetical protein